MSEEELERSVQSVAEALRKAFKVFSSRINQIEGALTLEGVKVSEEAGSESDATSILALFEEVFQNDCKSGLSLVDAGWRTIGALWRHATEKNKLLPWGKSKASFYNKMNRILPILLSKRLLVTRRLVTRSRGKAEFEYRINRERAKLEI